MTHERTSDKQDGAVEEEEVQPPIRKDSGGAETTDLPLNPVPPFADSRSPAAVAEPQSVIVLDSSKRGRSRDTRSERSLETQRTHSDIDVEAQEQQEPSRQDRSRAQSSTRSTVREAVKVPRSERRGLLCRFTVVAEVTNPYDYPRPTKWALTAIVAVAGAAAPMGSSIVLPALHSIAHDFHTSATTANLSVSLWVLSMSIFPLWWSSFSETLGRRTIYVTSFGLYVGFSILGGISKSISMLLVARALSGGAAASVQAVGAGSIADFWEVKERGTAIGIFYLGPLCGPLIAPIIGGVMTQRLGWRSVEWFLASMGAVVFFLILFCFPETLHRRKDRFSEAEAHAGAEPSGHPSETGSDGASVRPTSTRTTTAQSVHIKTKRYLGVLRRCFVDPLRIILCIQFPAIALCVIYGAATFSSLYILNISIQQTFEAKPYGYNSTIIGLLYIPSSLGYFLASIFGGRWVDRIMHREARRAGRYDEKGKLQFLPEDRMKENAWCGAILYSVALIAYGWTADYGVNLAAPLIMSLFFGLGSMVVFATMTTMLTELLPGRASSGIALNNLVRNICACIGTVVADRWIMAIGNGWVFTILGLISLTIGVLAIVLMQRYASDWRRGMDAKLARVLRS